MMTRAWSVLMLASAAWAAPEDGAPLFEKHCATCHKDPPVNRAPLPDALRKLSRTAIAASMEQGSMKPMAASLTPGQRTAIATYLAPRADEQAAGTGRCAAGYEPATDSTFWNGWGVDAANTRFQPANMARLEPAQVPRLKLKWAFGFAGAPAAIGQPTLVAGRLYFGSIDGTVHAVDAATGCTFWTFKAEATVRSAIALGTYANAKHAAIFGDVKANLYFVDARTGTPIWKLKLDDHPVARITGAPKVHGSRVYVPVSSVEEITGGSAKYGCCTFRGSVAAIDLESGKQVWKSYTIPEAPKPTRQTASGTQLHGPSGAAVWVSPTLDTMLRTLYVGTGNAYSEPHTRFSDAVIAMAMDTGSIKWVQQLKDEDGWNFACISPDKANCPEKAGPDVDIGASPILKTLKNGRRVLLVGQKSGIVHALDPDAEGRILWQSRLGVGGALGGIQWGMAADDRHVYAALSDVHLGQKAGGLFALDLETGKRVWYAEPAKPGCTGTRGCTPAQMAPVTAIPGVVFSGSMDGVLRAYEADTGRVIWEFNTLRDFDTVNGVKAHGGSLNATGPVAAAGMLFVNSGYGVLGGMPGNVLLAFAP